MAKSTNATNIMAQIQNLSAEEQGDLINAMRMLEVNAQDEMKFTNVTKAMQAAGWNPVKRAAAGVKAAMRNRMESTKGINSRGSARAMRLFGMRKSADFVDRWLTGAPKKKFKKVTIPSRGTATAADSGGGSSQSSITAFKKQLDYVTVRVDRIGDDVTDIKSLLMPKGIAAKNRSGDTKFTQFNPLAPPGEQFNTITESGKLTAMKPGKEFQQSAQKKAAMATAQLALKIMEKDRARVELKKKYEFKEEEERYGKADGGCDDLSEELKEGLEKVEDKVEESTSGGFFGSLLKFSLTLLPALSPILLTIAKLGLAGLVGLMAVKAAQVMWEWIKKWLDDWWDDLKLLKPLKALSDELRKRMVDLGILKSDAQYAEEEAANAAEGRVRGAVASSGNKLSIDQNIALLEKQRDAATNEEQKAAIQGAIDNLRQHHSQAKASEPHGQTIPAEIAAVGSDTVDTNYANVPVAPTPTPPPSAPSVGGTGVLTTDSGPKEIPYDTIKSKLGLTKEEWDVYRSTVAEIESAGAGGYAAIGGANDHYDGKYQMGEVAKMDAFRLMGMPYPGHGKKYSPARVAFRNDPMLQEKAFAAYTIANHGYLTGKSSKYKNLEKRKQLEVLGYSHNQGWSGGKNWLDKGVVGSDAFGTKGTKYSEALASSFENLESTKVATNVTPTPTIPGSQVDAQSRAHQSLTTGSGGGVTLVNAPVVNNTKVSNTVGKRPAQKADVLTQENSLIRTATRDSQHPLYTG